MFEDDDGGEGGDADADAAGGGAGEPGGGLAPGGALGGIELTKLLWPHLLTITTEDGKEIRLDEAAAGSHAGLLMGLQTHLQGLVSRMCTKK